MTDREKFMTAVISGLCANDKYVHDKTFSKDGLAKSLMKDAKDIADEFFKNGNPPA